MRETNFLSFSSPFWILMYATQPKTRRCLFSGLVLYHNSYRITAVVSLEMLDFGDQFKKYVAVIVASAH